MFIIINHRGALDNENTLQNFDHRSINNTASHNLESQKVADSIPDEVIAFFSWPNPSSFTMALVLTEPLTQMSTRNLLRGKGQPEHKADNRTAVCELIV
jgi:hypothetical protein